MRSTDFELVESFGIDSGELGDIAPELAFVLGVEWQLFREALSASSEVEQEVHRENAERLAEMARRRGLGVKLTPIDETWSRLRATPLPRLVLVPPC